MLAVLLATTGSTQARADPGSIFSGPAEAEALAAYWNPAAMTLLPRGTHVALMTTLMFARPTYQRETANPLDGKQYPASALSTLLPDPALGLVTSAGLDRFRFGLSASLPMMDGAAWGDTQEGKPAGTRHYATEGMMVQLSIQPSVAFRINRYISVGAGLDLMMIYSESKVLADFGARLNQIVNAGCTSDCPLNSAVSREDPTFDAMTSVNGSAWGAGGFVGVLVTPLPWLRLGAIFRTGGGELEVPVELNIEIPPKLRSAVDATGIKVNYPELTGSGVMTVVVPMSLAAAVTVGPLAWFSFTADVRWVNKAETGVFLINLHRRSSSLITDQSLILIHDDYVMVGLRGVFQVLDSLRLALRLEYSPVTVPDEYMTPISMDFESFSLHAGLAWQITAWLGVNVEYTRYFLTERQIEQSHFAPNARPTTKIEEGFDRPSPTGLYSCEVDRVGLGMTFSF